MPDIDWGWYKSISPFAHEPYAFQMIMCNRCGSIVFDCEAHDDWHSRVIVGESL